MAERDPATEPRVGDVWSKGSVLKQLGYSTYMASVVCRWHKAGFGPAVVIPLELAQRMIRLGDEVKGGAGYIADDLAAYMPQNEVGK